MAYVKEIDKKLDDAYDVMLVPDSVGNNVASEIVMTTPTAQLRIRMDSGLV